MCVGGGGGSCNFACMQCVGVQFCSFHVNSVCVCMCVCGSRKFTLIPVALDNSS